MIIGVLKETFPREKRVALVPTCVTKLRELGYEITVEEGAGLAAHYSNDEYREAGASIASGRADAISAAQVILQVRGLGSNPEHGRDDLQHFRTGQVVIGQQDPLWVPEHTRDLAQTGVTVLALETIPRISRAQSMDVLSSMATIAGYKAALLAANRLAKMFPMLMTAAGTITAARVLVLGAGVAGLQAIATARRLGAVVQGYDIRRAAQEQIQSLGAKALELPLEQADAEGAGGYAREQGEDFNQRQREFLSGVVAESDVVITTASIPGRPSPMLIPAAAIDGMRPGSVVVDLAAERGGNCELTQADEEVERGGVRIFGPTDFASQVPRHASQMFSNNLTTLLTHLTQDGQIQLDWSDEITDDVVVAHGRELRHPLMREKLGLPALDASAQPEPAAEPTEAHV